LTALTKNCKEVCAESQTTADTTTAAAIAADPLVNRIGEPIAFRRRTSELKLSTTKDTEERVLRVVAAHVDFIAGC
jgi:hypothetical protein